jgi:hypothetical protein
MHRKTGVAGDRRYKPRGQSAFGPMMLTAQGPGLCLIVAATRSPPRQEIETCLSKHRFGRQQPGHRQRKAPHGRCALRIAHVAQVVPRQSSRPPCRHVWDCLPTRGHKLIRVTVSIDDRRRWPGARMQQPAAAASSLAGELMIGALARHPRGR